METLVKIGNTLRNILFGAIITALAFQSYKVNEFYNGTLQVSQVSADPLDDVTQDLRR